MAKVILISISSESDRMQVVSMLPLLGRYCYAVNPADECNLVISDVDIGYKKAQEVFYDADKSEVLASGRVVKV